MANNKFVVKNGLQTQNVDFVSPDQLNKISIDMLNTDTLSVSGNSGQLFSITDSMTGVIYAVNDISGVPSIEVYDSGQIRFAELFGNVLLGTGTDNATDKLQVNGSITGTVLKSSVATGTAPLTVASTTAVTNLNADMLDGNHASAFYLATNPNGYTSNTGTVTSVSGTGTVAGLSLSGTVTASGSITLGGTLSTPVSTINDSTTVGQNLVKLANPSAISFIRINADNTVSTLNSSDFRTAIGVSTQSWTSKTANYTAVAGDKIIADTSGGVWTLTLPATPTAGNAVIIADGANWSTNNLTVARNGSTIEGAAEDLVLDIKGIQVELIYSGTTWEVFAFTGPTGVQVTDNTSLASPVYPLWVSSTSGFQSTSLSSSKLYFTPNTGQLNATVFNSLSDASLKTNVDDIRDSKTIVESLKPVSFDWKDTGQHSFGLIAQEVEQVLPDIVSTNPDTGIKSVSYMQLIPFLIAEIQALRQEVKLLKERQ